MIAINVKLMAPNNPKPIVLSHGVLFIYAVYESCMLYLSAACVCGWVWCTTVHVHVPEFYYYTLYYWLLELSKL
jgi:hypothetical protein